MATDLGRVKSPATNKYDAVVASQLEQAEKRIRLLDLTAGLLGFTALCLAYVVFMVVCDANWLLTARTRQMSLIVFCLGGGAYLVWAVLRPLRFRVNPYYAAQRVERMLPDAKNSIVNWVDLHAQPLPPAIRGALGQRAAKDAARVDLERAIGGRRAGWMGGLAAVFAVAFVLSFLLLGPAPFFSLLKRTFNPFSSANGISTRTQLDILKPVGGDAIVTVGQSISFVVEVGGRVPDPKGTDAVRLVYRHEEADPWLERPLIQGPSREWTTSLSAAEVKNGFWYRVAGGDAVTQEYRVSVRAAPAITDFLTTYHFRPYVVRPDEVRRERDLRELRGTEVLLRVQTNRAPTKAWMEIEGKTGKSVVLSTLDPTEPRGFFVRYVIKEDGKYRLFFLTAEEESYADADASLVTAIPDAPPTVELTEPGKDIRLPADALLSLEGKAGDDIGVKSVRLRMQVIGGDKLQDKPYRTDEQMRLVDGGYPREVEYKDFVELSGVRSIDGRAVALRGGMELEYWLEASDACDYPQPGVAESKHFRILLTDPEKNEAKQKQDQQQAEKEKKEHEQKQDQKRQKEERQREQQKQEQQARNQEEENKSKENDKGAGEQGQPKDGEQKNEGENKNDHGGRADKNNGQGAKDDLPNEDQKTEEQIKNALEKKEEKQGEGKPEKCEQGEGKGDGNKPDGGESSGAKSESESKGAAGQESKASSENKEKGPSQPGDDASKGDGKGENSSNPPDGDKGEGKQGGDPKNPSGEGKSGESKGQPEAAASSGENKPSGDPDGKKESGEGKPQPQGQGQESSDNKPVDKNGEGTQRQTGEAKDNGNPSRGEAKTEGESKEGANAEQKPDASSPRQDSSAKGDAKPSPDEGEKGKTAQGQSKPDAGAQARNANAKDVRDLQRELQNKNDAAREEAKRQLERIEKEAFDPDAREKAGEALDKKEPRSGSSEKNEASQGDGGSGTTNGEKEGQPGSKKGDKQNGQNTQGSGSASGGGGDRNSGKPDGGGRGGASAPGKSEKPGSHRAAQMQLEDFAKRVDKDILKEAGVSEEAWKKYLESKRKQVAPRETTRPEAPAEPQQAKPLPSMGGRTIEPSGSGPGDTHGPDRGQPPPGYRDAFREFTRQMSKGK